MTGQAFFVLTALADGPRHGYGIVREAAELSHGRVKLKIGGLYGVLDRLAAEGLIEPDREEAHDGRLRRYFRLTRDGRGRWLNRPSSAPPPPGWSGPGWARPARRQPDERRPGPGAAVPAGAAAAARLLVAPDAARAQTATSAPPPYPHLG
jgi:PadR family transcriptional regulator PadR